MYELLIRADQDDVVIEPRGLLDEQAAAHLRECVAAARVVGVRARVDDHPDTSC
jgi:hypothetical protein